MARRAGVSRQTVSNVLNAPARVAEETAARVRDAIEALGYRPNRTARNLRTRTSRLIGYRIERSGPDGGNAVLDGFLHALSAAARAYSFHVLLFTPDDEADELATYDELLRTATVDAFVLSGTHREDDRPGWLASRGVPFACFGRPWGATGRFAWVDVDGAAGTDAAVEHLVSRGHRRIGFLGWPTGSGAGDDRAAGWRRAVRRHGLPAAGLLRRCTNDVTSAARATTALLAAAEPVTALVCASDTLAFGARVAAGDRRLAIVGFDDSPTAAVLNPPLSSVRQPLDLVGREVVRLLHLQITGADPAPGPVLLAPELVVRDLVDP